MPNIYDDGRATKQIKSITRFSFSFVVISYAGAFLDVNLLNDFRLKSSDGDYRVMVLAKHEEERGGREEIGLDRPKKNDEFLRMALCAFN